MCTVPCLVFGTSSKRRRKELHYRHHPISTFFPSLSLFRCVCVLVESRCGCYYTHTRCSDTFPHTIFACYPDSFFLWLFFAGWKQSWLRVIIFPLLSHFRVCSFYETPGANTFTRTDQRNYKYIYFAMKKRTTKRNSPNSFVSFGSKWKGRKEKDGGGKKKFRVKVPEIIIQLQKDDCCQQRRGFHYAMDSWNRDDQVRHRGSVVD